MSNQTENQVGMVEQAANEVVPKAAELAKSMEKVSAKGKEKEKEKAAAKSAKKTSSSQAR